MSRTIHDLTPDERKAYYIWCRRLEDRTLPATEHDQARREIDNLLWKGPNAQVLAVKAQLAEVLARLERVEFHMGLADTPPVYHDGDGVIRYVETGTPNPPAPINPDQHVYESLPVKDDAPEKPDGRGRPKNRFAPEKDANKKWRILDRETGEYATGETFPRRKDAADAANVWNSKYPVESTIDAENQFSETETMEATDSDDPFSDLGL